MDAPCVARLSAKHGNMEVNTLRSRQNGRHYSDDIFKCIFLNDHVRISFKFSLKFVPKGPINSIPALEKIMAWRRQGDKPLSEPMMVGLLTHICVTLPQWVKRVPVFQEEEIQLPVPRQSREMRQMEICFLCFRAVQLPWIFPGAPLKINGTPGNIQGNLTALMFLKIDLTRNG